MTLRSLRPFDCSIRIISRAVDMFDLQPYHLPSTQAATVTETEHHARLEVAGDRQQPLRLVRAHHRGSFGSRIDLGGEIQLPQRHRNKNRSPVMMHQVQMLTPVSARCS